MSNTMQNYKIESNSQLIAVSMRILNRCPTAFTLRRKVGGKVGGKVGAPL